MKSSRSIVIAAVGGAVLLAAAVVVILTYLLIPKPAAEPALPVPNGYDDLLKAASQAISREHRSFGDGSDDKLRDLVNENRSALSLARAGLKHEVRVTTDYKLGPAEYVSQHMPILANFKKLALAFRAEGELAEREGKTNDAARIYLDGIRFGQGLCRGGLLIDRLVGIGCERICYEPLQALVPDLGAALCRELARELEQVEGGREPMQATWEEESRWAMRTAGFRERIVLVLQSKALKAARANAASKAAEIQTRERELILQLAARAYELERGKAAARSGDLVPEYLRTAPQDPITGKELTLEP